MRKFIFLIVLFAGVLPARSPARGEGEVPGKADSAYDRTVAMVSLRQAPPVWIRDNLERLNRDWGLFPSIQYLIFPVEESGGEILFLRGRMDEVEEASRLAAAMDGFYPPSDDQPVISPVPLEHLSGGSMRAKLLALARNSGLDLAPEQFLVFPPGPSGSLFFLGPPAEAKRIRDLKAELDQPRYGSPLDLWGGFYREFRNDLSSHFLTVSTYVASALILLCLHFLICRIPWLGRKYQRWFSLIWTRLIQDVRGRDFAYEVIKDLVQTAVDAVEQAARRPLGSGGKAPVSTDPGEKKSRALAIARDLLKFRGFNPDDPRIKQMISDLIEASVYRLRRPEPGPTAT